MTRFGLIGVAGFIAPRHLRAIKENECHLSAALDKSDSVGIIDGYFPDAAFFNEFERFDRHIDKLRRQGEGIDFLSVCSPNYLHDSHIRFGLRSQADVICEKPLVLNPWNIDALALYERESGRSVYNILQLRLHPSIIALRNKVRNEADKIYDIDLTYITSRGNWYYTSWKGDESKSGGVAMNIGVHFYDMLLWIFGGVQKSVVHLYDHDRVAGFLQLERANVRYFLSINGNTLPNKVKEHGKQTFRLLSMNGEEVEFSDGFTNLHTESYRRILSGEGYKLEEARSSIELVSDIRHTTPVGLTGEYHPLAKLLQTPRPFSR